MGELGTTIEDGDVVFKFDKTLLLLTLTTEGDKTLFDTTVLFEDKTISSSGSVLQHKTVVFDVSLATDTFLAVGIGLDIVTVMDSDGVLVVGICLTACNGTSGSGGDDKDAVDENDKGDDGVDEDRRSL